MRLTYKFNVAKNDSISFLCRASNNLYNQANYYIKQGLKDNKWVRYNELNRIMKDTKNLEGQINYRLLKIQTSQQLLRLIDRNWSAYFRSLKEYRKNPKKFKGIPKPPKFLNKDSENLLIYTNQNSIVRDGYIHLSKNVKVYIPQFEKYKDQIKSYQQIRILPKKGFYEVEIIYEYEQKNEMLDYNSFGSIDFGINNIATLVTHHKPIIYNGKPCKSINQFYNKTYSRLKSIRDHNKKDKYERRSWNNVKLNKLLIHRNNAIKDYFHKISRHMVNYLIKNQIGNVIIGLNRNWKDSISIGKKNNQNFLLLPHLKLFNLIKYKCEMIGIKVIEQEESYTSKCDALSLEAIEKHVVYTGKRVKRGLFQSSVGRLINADVNGALNILRKVVGDSHACVGEIINSGFLYNPIKVRIA